MKLVNVQQGGSTRMAETTNKIICDHFLQIFQFLMSQFLIFSFQNLLQIKSNELVSKIHK